MPMPKPQDGESMDEFMSRCMGDEMMNGEYPETDQRYAVCMSQWEQDGKGVAAFERRGFIPEVKDLDPVKRRVTHLISNATIDRAGDMIDPLGWKLGNYKKNPVVLLNHSYLVQDIIGRSTHIDKDKDGLYSTTEFGPHMLGEEAFLLVQAGLARAWSVGFAPLKHHTIAAGKSKELDCPACKGARGQNLWNHFTECDLLEYSLVAIPMNQDVVMNAVKAGLTKAHVPMFFRSPEAAQTGARDGANPQRDTAHSLRQFARRLSRARHAQELAEIARHMK